MQIWPRNTEAERSSMSHRVVVIDNSLSTLEVVLPALILRGCTMDGGRVIAETTMTDVLGVIF